MKMYNAVIFDFFGTLTNQNCAPEDKIVDTWKLNERDGFDYEFVEDVVCGTACETPFGKEEREKYYRTLINKLRLSVGSERKLHEITRSDINGEVLIDGAIEIVDWVKKRGYKLGMISDLANPDYDLSTKWGFADRFDFRHMSFDPEWVNSGDYERVLKPDPAVFLRVLRKLGVEAKESIMIGNSLHSDIEPARKLGMRAILVDYHDKHPDDCDRVRSLDELRGIL